VENEKEYFLKTIIPSRKATKKYLEVLRSLYHITCELMEDPITGAPLLVNIQRAPESR